MKITTTTLIGIITISFCFIILLLTQLGVAHTSETMQTQIVQLVSSLMVLVLGFYFGATNKQSEIPNQTQQTMTTIFWDIQSLNDAVVEVNGVTAQYQSVSALTSQNQNYAIVLDDTDVPVLTFTGQSTSTLKLQGVNGVYQVTSVQSSFAGGRPTRPR